MVQPRVFDMAALVRDAERLLQRVLPETIQVVTYVPAAPALVRADPAQLEQVLVNLAINARDAMPEGGQLSIALGHTALDDDDAPANGVSAGRYVVLAVRDTGIGMDPPTIARAFEPFFTTKPIGKGTGLGLATAYGVVTQAGGALRVESAPGDGAVFEVLLPAVGSGELQPIPYSLLPTPFSLLPSLLIAPASPPPVPRTSRRRCSRRARGARRAGRGRRGWRAR